MAKVQTSRLQIGKTYYDTFYGFDVVYFGTLLYPYEDDKDRIHVFWNSDDYPTLTYRPEDIKYRIRTSKNRCPLSVFLIKIEDYHLTRDGVKRI